jgi:hypothetical protein
MTGSTSLGGTEVKADLGFLRSTALHERAVDAADEGLLTRAEFQLFAQRLERVKGIEPSYEAWEAAVLPLNYTRILQLVDF